MYQKYLLSNLGKLLHKFILKIKYAILLSVMVAAEIAAGITAAVLRDEVKSQFLSLVKSSVNEYSKNPDFKNFLDKIQQEVYH